MLEAIIGIIVVIWVLISLFGGGKKQPGRGPGRLPGMPPFSGGPQMPRPPLGRTQRTSPAQSRRSVETRREDYPSPSASMEDPYASSQSSMQDTQTGTLSGEIYRSKLGSYEPEQSMTDDFASTAYSMLRSEPDSIRSSEAASAASRRSVQTSGDSSKNVGMTVPGQREMLNGIIWSEILGPPKSRRRMR
jgi:hypothetical protein